MQYFVAAPGVRGWDDLRGRTVAALSIGSCSYWFMRELLQQHALDPDADLNIVGLGERYPRVVELFRSGELACAVISEPNVSIGEGNGAFRVMRALTDPAFFPDMQWGVVVAAPGTLANEPDLIRAVLRGCQQSYRYAAAHRDEWIAFGADYFGVARETMARSIEREIAGLHFDGEIDMRGLQQMIDLQTRLGAIKAPLNAEDIVGKLNADINVVLKGPEASGTLLKLGFTPVGGTPEHFREIIGSNIEKWARVIRNARIKVE